MSRYSQAYLDAVLERVRSYLPPRLWQDLHTRARGQAGGKTPRKPKPEQLPLEPAGEGGERTED